jgi:hypothetical protein
MKIIDLRKKIIRNFSISGIIIALLATGLFLNTKSTDILDERLRKSKNEISEVQQKSQNLESKHLELKKYIEIWKNISSEKIDESGINMDEVNKLLSILAKKHYILKTDIKVNLPTVIKTGIFNTKKTDILFTETTLNFEAVDDANSVEFLRSFLDSLPGYYVITSLSIEKEKELSTQDFVSISRGVNPRIISGNIKFFWYVFKGNSLAVIDDSQNKRLIK